MSITTIPKMRLGHGDRWNLVIKSDASDLLTLQGIIICYTE